MTAARRPLAKVQKIREQIGHPIVDADAHVMETPGWLRDHADPGVRERIEALEYESGNELRQTGDPGEQRRDLESAFDNLRRKHESDEYRALEAEEIMLRKNFAATGSFIAEHRTRALDLLGFASQLVFNTFHNSRLHDWEHSGDIEFAIGAARARQGRIRFVRILIVVLLPAPLGPK